MMRITLFLFCLIGLGCNMDPCGLNKQHFLKKMERLTVKIEDKDDLSKNELKALDEQVEVLVNDCYDKFTDDLTKIERKAFWSDVSAYYLDRFGAEAIDRIEEGLDQLGGALSENLGDWLDESANNLEEWIEEFKNKEGGDLKIEIDGDLEDLKLKLKELFEEEEQQ
jgi:hypothetical protein